MDCEFHFQDPASPDTVYLLEAIIDASRGAESCSGIFAFASRGGVDSLLGDPEIQDFLRESPMSSCQLHKMSAHTHVHCAKHGIFWPKQGVAQIHCQ